MIFNIQAAARRHNWLHNFVQIKNNVRGQSAFSAPSRIRKQRVIRRHHRFLEGRIWDGLAFTQHRHFDASCKLSLVQLPKAKGQMKLHSKTASRLFRA
jgi:hypothetical protein